MACRIELFPAPFLPVMTLTPGESDRSSSAWFMKLVSLILVMVPSLRGASDHEQHEDDSKDELASLQAELLGLFGDSNRARFFWLP